jgi:hypothetical protein
LPAELVSQIYLFQDQDLKDSSLDETGLYLMQQTSANGRITMSKLDHARQRQRSLLDDSDPKMAQAQ